MAEEGQRAPDSRGAVPWKESDPCALSTLCSGARGVDATRAQRTAPRCAGSPLASRVMRSEPLAGPPRARLQALCLVASSALTCPGTIPTAVVRAGF